MSEKHTPGPWSVVHKRDVSELGNSAFEVADVEDFRICANWRRDTGRPIDDARLIAAAPELLEALREISELLDMATGCFGISLPRDADGPAAKARAAIAKATGSAE